MDNQILQTFIENESNFRSTEKQISLEDWRKLSTTNEELFLFVRDIDVYGKELASYKNFGKPIDNSQYNLKKKLVAICFIALALALTILTIFSIYKLSSDARPSSLNFALLSDSSEVQLFGDSRLTLDNSFDSANRSLELNGKAFFAVQHNDNLPFIITTKNGTVTVKGTSLLVEEMGSKLKVAVREGVVEFKNNNYTKILKKNEACIFSNDDFKKVSNLNFSNSLLTKSYQEVSVREIIEELRDEHDVMVDFKSSISISDCIFNGNFENASVFDILNEWKIMFDLEYVIENGIIKILKIDCDY